MNEKHRDAVGIFDKYAEQYARKYADHPAYVASYQRLIDLLPAEGARILDIACGPGLASAYLLQHIPSLNITGIDLSGRMLALARTHAPLARFERRDCRRLADLEERYDGLVCGFFVPYLARDEVRSFLKDSRQIISTGGILYLSAIEGAYEESGYQSRDGKDSLFTYYYSREELQRQLLAAGYAIEDWERASAVGSGAGELFFYARAV